MACRPLGSRIVIHRGFPLFSFIDFFKDFLFFPPTFLLWHLPFSSFFWGNWWVGQEVPVQASLTQGSPGAPESNSAKGLSSQQDGGGAGTPEGPTELGEQMQPLLVEPRPWEP